MGSLIKYVPWPEKAIEKVLFVIAMPEEAGCVCKAFNASETYSDGFVTIYEQKKQNTKEEENANLPDLPKVFIVIPKIDSVYGCPSISTESACLATYIGIQKTNPDLVVSAGTCGGIQQKTDGASIKQGDVFIPSTCKYLSREIVIPAFQGYITGIYPILDPEIVKGFLAAGNAASGNIYTGIIDTANSFVSDDSAAQDAGCNAVEMECTAEARVCHILNKPFTCIKIVSDVDPGPCVSAENRGKAFETFLTTAIDRLATHCTNLVTNIGWKRQAQ